VLTWDAAAALRKSVMTLEVVSIVSIVILEESVIGQEVSDEGLLVEVHH
jgi:hypothetical protein